MLELRLLKGPSGKGQSFSLASGREIIVGRESSCDIRLDSSGVSKKHCRLTVLPGSKIEVEDLKSSNGTFVNGIMIKKHVLYPGDSLNVHDFTLQLLIRAPEVAPSIAKPMLDFPTDNLSPAPEVEAADVEKGNSLNRWISANIYPLADSISDSLDLRALLGIFFVIWSALIILLTAAPFSDKANGKMREQAAEVAKLYARQLARLNQQAIIDQRFRDLIAELDARRGQTPGLISSMILDATSSQVLAPADLFGQSLTTTYAAVAVNKDTEFVQFDNDGIAYASVPIKIGTPEGNKTTATAFVVFNASANQFTLPMLLQAMVDSLLKALLISLLLLIFVYRWIDGSVQRLASRVDQALLNSEVSVSSPVKWPALVLLSEQVSNLLGRANQGGGNQNSLAGRNEAWAIGAVANSGQASAAFNEALTVIAWNSEMERLIGIRANIALGADISGASRDVAFESTIRELAAQDQGMAWTPVSQTIDFGGVSHRISMIYGNGAHLVTLSKLEDS